MNPVQPASLSCSCPSCGRRVDQPHPQYPFCSEQCHRAEQICQHPDQGALVRMSAPSAAAAGDSMPEDWHEFITG